MSFATFIYMNHLGGKLHTTSDANVTSTATILQVRLDTAQDASRLKCWAVDAHFAKGGGSRNPGTFSCLHELYTNAEKPREA